MSTNALVNVKSTEHFSFDDSDVLNALVDGKPHLKAMDVCLAIGYNEDTYRKALIRFVPEKYEIIYENLKNLGVVRLINNRVGLTRLKTPKNNIIFLTEPGLYCLLLRSKMEKAEPFMEWVVETILPKEVRQLTKEMEEKDREHRVAIQRKDSHIALIAYNHDIANGIIRARDIEIENLMRNRHVPLSGKGYDEVFIIVKKNCDSEELYPLYLICRQKRSANQALLKLRKRYPHLEILTQFDTPNSIHRWNEIKQRNPAVIQWSDRHFRILNPDIELEMFALTDGVVG